MLLKGGKQLYSIYHEIVYVFASKRELKLVKVLLFSAEMISIDWHACYQEWHF